MKKRLIALIIVVNNGCSVDPVIEDSEPDYVPVDVLAVADAIPRYEKRTRAGNPVQYEVLGKQYKVLTQSKGYKKTGVASWYGTKFHGRKTSNGETYNMYGMTAAHKTLPIPSYVRVTHLKNNRSVVVRVNDRGPFHDNRIIDLSYTAAVKLGIQQAGTGSVEVTALEFDSVETNEKKKVSQLGPQQGDIFYLQVGAFVDASNAQQLQQKLSASGISACRIQSANNQGNELFKVQVGPLYSDQQAEQENQKLVQIGFSQSQLIVEK